MEAESRRRIRARRLFYWSLVAFICCVLLLFEWILTSEDSVTCTYYDKQNGTTVVSAELGTFFVGQTALRGELPPKFLLAL